LTRKQKGWIYVATLANTVVLFFLTIWLWSLPWYAGDEKLMIWTTSALKFNFREIPENKDFAFINVSYDLILIDKNDEFGFPIGNVPITDRQKLTRLFEIINTSSRKPNYILCDIFFEKSTEHDQALNEQMLQMDNLVISYHLDENLQPRIPVTQDINRGLTDYVIGNVFEGVYKFQLYFNDSLRLTPLIIYDELENVKSKKVGPLVKVGSWWTLNHFIMNYRLLQQDLENQSTGFNPISLGELLMYPEDVAMDFLAGKIVVIGDFFEVDKHETIFEITAGPVILINAYLSLLHQDTKVGIIFFLIIFIAFFGLSYMAISPEDLIEKYIRKKYGNIRWVRSLTSFVIYLLFLILVSVITFFLYNIHLNVFLLTVYLFIIEKVSNFLLKKRSRKTEEQLNA